MSHISGNFEYFEQKWNKQKIKSDAV